MNDAQRAGLLWTGVLSKLEHQNIWVVPLENIVEQRDIEFYTKAGGHYEIGEKGRLHQVLKGQRIRSGDYLLFLWGTLTKALGRFSSVTEEGWSWEQAPLEMESGITLVRENKAWTLEEEEARAFWTEAKKRIWPMTKKTRFWRLTSRKHNVARWEYWKERHLVHLDEGFLGDISLCHDFSEVEQRRKEAGRQGQILQSSIQHWSFRNVAVGDRIVVTGSRHQEVWGLGIVVEGYQFGRWKEDPLEEDTHFLRVEWEDFSIKIVPSLFQKRGLFMEIARKDFNEIFEKEERTLQTENFLLEHPQGRISLSQEFDPYFEEINLILYGPPGTGKTYQVIREAVRRLLSSSQNGKEVEEVDLYNIYKNALYKGQIAFITFHQGYGYEEFIEGIRPVLEEGSDVQYELHQGVFKQIALRAAASGLVFTEEEEKQESTQKKRESLPKEMQRETQQFRQEAIIQEVLDGQNKSAYFRFTTQTPQYVLVIDEINRGNISKIMGELITLLEPDKRLTKANELRLPLAYTPQHRFGVPPNLHILGTMNTADRSIALMDIALRRRFTFREMMPDAGVLREELKEILSDALLALVVDIFHALNQRITYLLDRDHQLGHAFFLRIRSLKDLRECFSQKVIPMLQEYFYGAWDKIAMVLGCPYDEGGKPQRRSPFLLEGGRYKAPLICAYLFDPTREMGYSAGDWESKVDYSVQPALRAEDWGRKDWVAAFLGILSLTEEAYRQREQELLSVED